MKKQLIAVAVASATLAMSSIASADNNWFVGGQIANSNQKYSVSSGNHTVDTVVESAFKRIDSPTQFSARIGKYINNNVRLYTTLSYAQDSKSEKYGNLEAKAELTHYTALFSADYLFGNYAVKPFIGASAGGQIINGELSLNNASGSENVSGFVYGAQTGLTWQFADNWNLEGGYQYLKSTAEYKTLGTKIDIDYIQNLYLSVDYSF